MAAHVRPALYQDAIDGYLDVSTYDAVVERKARERARLSALEVG